MEGAAEEGGMAWVLPRSPRPSISPGLEKDVGSEEYHP